MVPRILGKSLWLMLTPVVCTGCSAAWYNAFLNPTELGNFRESRVGEIRRTISFRDKPSGIVGAVDPAPDDLVATMAEYQIGPGDVLAMELADFLQIGASTQLTLTVDELGRIDIPQLGWINAEGRTVSEVKADLIQKAKAAGIYLQDDNPMVRVAVEIAQQRLYHLGGDVLYPHTYPIPRPDFRLREAILVGGGLVDQVKTVWVFRNEPRQKRVRKRSVEQAGPAGAPPAEQPAPAPPVTPVMMSAFEAAAGAGPRPAGSNPQPGSRPASGRSLALPADEQQDKELIEAVSPATEPFRGGQGVPPAGQPATQPSAPAPGLPTYIFVNDRFIEVPAATTQKALGQAPGEAPGVGPGPPPEEPVDWEALASEGQRRVIRIPADKLRDGDPSCDIAIQHQDWIRLDAGPQGLYYMAGHVLRPGPYPFSGEEVTLTQAVATAGGLEQLAWPTRCEIRRRLDGDRDEITQWDLARIVEGKDPDLFLKPGDVVNVGTHAIAPLLATIRNSFRLTYGFGFVWDRNFADIEQVGGQQNPTERRRVDLLRRFPGLF